MPVGKPIWKLNGTWTRLVTSDRLRRSSQSLSIINQTAYIFGGEVQPRLPVDDQIDIVALAGDGSTAFETKSTSTAPSPRVGTASASLNGKMYIFSGRGGIDMAPIEEHGAVWSFDPKSSTWSLIKPADESKSYPPARSYHCATSDGTDAFFIHSGCPAQGRLSDLWKFDVGKREWVQGPDAPGAQRGGASIAYSGGKLYRMNGFDGKTEQGGSIDIFDISTNTWTTTAFKADGNDGPEPRSVCALLPIKLAQKRKLVTLFGERDPSSLGHAGAGKMLSDAWVYDIEENWWTRLEPSSENGVPDPRGWFDADVLGTGQGNDSIVVHGGLAEDNTRLDDVWVLSF